jgi:DNA polymerase/3'-5' exonuclease PolX
MKRKFPRTVAGDVAIELLALLSAFTERIEVAGSLRRGKSVVGDVEILFIPRYEEEKGFFDTVKTERPRTYYKQT